MIFILILKYQVTTTIIFIHWQFHFHSYELLLSHFFYIRFPMNPCSPMMSSVLFILALYLFNLMCFQFACAMKLLLVLSVNVLQPDRVTDFCKKNKLQLIIRAHECVMDGFERFAQGQLITLFSATNYCGKLKELDFSPAKLQFES